MRAFLSDRRKIPRIALPPPVTEEDLNEAEDEEVPPEEEGVCLID